MRLFVASGNAKKLHELRELVADLPVEVLAAGGDLPMPEVDEDGETFEHNAEKKAREVQAFLAARGHGDLWVLADDSGLEVDALGGRPGVRSARYSEDRVPTPDDASNNAKLLEELAEVPDEQRGARFVCVLALCDPEGRIRVRLRGTVEGSLLRSPRGSGGFGYDPLFLHAGGRTTAEMRAEEKAAVSHRGQAMAMLRGALHEYLRHRRRAEAERA